MEQKMTVIHSIYGNLDSNLDKFFLFAHLSISLFDGLN